MIKTWFAAVTTLAFLATIGLSTLYAQERQRTRLRTPPTQVAEPKEVTLSGTLVDLQCYMSGKFIGKSLEAYARNCIRRGMPAALETNDGLVVLGMARGNAGRFAAHAMKTVDVTGTLYEKRGLKYMEVTLVKKSAGSDFELEPEDEYEDQPEEEPEDQQEEEPEEEEPEDPEEPDDPEAP